ncbi:MAG: glycosyltransferase family 4 protein [Holophagales bacterium]|nr:glycosyltransferase family 4 protein [Holophagales bacterium]
MTTESTEPPAVREAITAAIPANRDSSGTGGDARVGRAAGRARPEASENRATGMGGTGSGDPGGRPRFRLRALLRPLHPRRIGARLLHLAHRLGWHHVRLWASGLDPRRLRSSVAWWRDCRREVARRRDDPRLTVAVDVSPFWEPLTGIGWYTYRLLEAMKDRDDVALRLYGPDLVDKGDTRPPCVELPEGPALERVRYRVPEDFSLVWYWFSDRLRAREGRLIAADRNRLRFAPNFVPPPRFRGVGGRLVVTVHDLTVERFPETMRESTRRELQGRLRGTLEAASWVLTDSEAVRKEMVDARLAPAERVSVAWLAPGATAPGRSRGEPRPPAGRPERYVLFVGTLEPRKDLGTLVRAFGRWRAATGGDVGGARLVVCGGEGWKSRELADRLRKAEEEGWLRRYGYLPDEEISALYRDAEWLALPSIYEGFGLPAVEAMAWGVPLLLSEIPVLREVAGEAALYAPPGDVDAWAGLLERALGAPDERRRLADLARRRSELFDWARTAERTVEAWRSALDPEPSTTSGQVGV